MYESGGNQPIGYEEFPSLRIDVVKHLVGTVSLAFKVRTQQRPGFCGAKFQVLLHNTGVLSVPTTASNLQGNSIIKWIHQAIGQVIHTLVDIRNLKRVPQVEALIDEALAMAKHATQCASLVAL